MRTPAAAIAVGASVLFAAGIAVSAGAMDLLSVQQAAPAQCDRATALVPRVRGGLPWQQHRRWLEAAGDDPLPGQSHLVRNERTGEWFRWYRTDSPSDAPRFMVPTRYAEIANRRWHDDPWSYCLVLAPQPPFRFSKGGFVSSVYARPASLEAETPATIAAVVTARNEATVLIDIELRDERGLRVSQWVFDDQTLDKDRAAVYEVQWHPASDLEPGIYTIMVGVFTAGWGPLHHWNDGSGVLLVTRPESPVEP